MSPSKKELPPCERKVCLSDILLIFLADIRTSTQHPEKVSCNYCVQHAKTPWFLEKNLPQHLKCLSHLKSVGEEEARTATTERINCLRAEGLARLQQSERWYAPLSQLNQPEVPAPVMPAPEIGELQMWEDFDDQPGVFLLDANGDPQINPPEQKEAEFYRDLDRARMNLDPGVLGFEEFYVERDDDEALTKVMEDLSK